MRARFHVGERVRVPFGRLVTTGVVVEDRGGIGIGGRHLYRVEVPLDPDEPATVEVPEDDLTAWDPSEAGRVELDPAKVKTYLANGGLVSILRRNLQGDQPVSVWLCPDILGNITYTFERTRGVLGGERIPFLALHGERVFRHKQDQILAFLQSFGLSRRDAEEVLSAVGTKP